MNSKRSAPSVRSKQVVRKSTRALDSRRLRNWYEQHRYSFFSSFGGLIDRPWASAFTVLLIGLALALPLLFFLVVENATNISSSWLEAREISVFLKTKTEQAKINELAERLHQRRDVASVVIKTAEQGLAEFRAQSGFAEALQVLSYNPLPTVLLVLPQPELDSSSELSLVEALRSEPEVDLVQYDAVWRKRLIAILDLVKRSAELLSILLGLGLLLVVGNSVRIDIQTRREEIAISQLLGASKAFVRRPFLYTGFWYGVASGVVAVILTFLVHLSLADAIARLLLSYDGSFTLVGLNVPLTFVVLFISAVLGWLGAWIASSRYLAEKNFR